MEFENVLCGTVTTKIHSVLHEGRCGPAITWAEVDWVEFTC